MVRHNLTVVIDGNPVTKESKEYIPEFYAKNKVEVICSLPYYQEFFTDKQRGDGVFKKSIEVLKRFNSLGYGSNKDLKLNLVYNPIGAYLPAAQEVLEKQYKKELLEKFNIRFNELFVITNMPIHRFKKQLAKLNTYDDYMTKLVNAYNPDAAKGIMCRSLISVSYDGNLYDCDFNQMLEMNVDLRSMNVFNFDYKKLLTRKIMFDSHCFGCTAGAGSSCGGEITN
ncbi:UNVERIFIED_CONTAM: hypothetical protein GTU68_041337 [Idotea baltica]|nr:hypothetical protein [Idotea baltica]